MACTSDGEMLLAFARVAGAERRLGLGGEVFLRPRKPFAQHGGIGQRRLGILTADIGVELLDRIVHRLA